MKLILPTLLALTIAGCGFSLRGFNQVQSVDSIPIFIDFSDSGMDYALQQKFTKQANMRGFLIAGARDDTLQLKLNDWRRSRESLSLDENGEVTRYQLILQVDAEVQSHGGVSARQNLLMQEEQELGGNSSADATAEQAIYRRLEFNLMDQALDFAAATHFSKR